MSPSCLNLIRIRSIKPNAKKANGLFLENPIFMVFLWGLKALKPNETWVGFFMPSPIGTLQMLNRLLLFCLTPYLKEKSRGIDLDLV